MKCCAYCFIDRGLRTNIIPNHIDSKGICSFCNSYDVELLSPRELGSYFEQLIDMYVPSESGSTLVELISNDWLVFNEERLQAAHAHRLLGEILNDGEIIRKTFDPPRTPDDSKLETWEIFCNELMYENRFFPSNKIDEDKLERLLWHLRLNKEEFLEFGNWFRARMQKSESELIPIEEMGAPPNHLTSQGRANPAGIPYLYVASNPATAVAEIRPHTGEYATVAEISINSKIEILDLRHPRMTISPFLVPLSPYYIDEESELAFLREDIDFLVRLGQELTRPVLPHAAAIEYLPSQFLCEFIKNCGYHGVIYESSVGDGVNFAVFEHEDNAQIINARSYQVARVSVELGQ